jgi:hypothetical protein
VAESSNPVIEIVNAMNKTSGGEGPIPGSFVSGVASPEREGKKKQKPEQAYGHAPETSSISFISVSRFLKSVTHLCENTVGRFLLIRDAVENEIPLKFRFDLPTVDGAAKRLRR